MARAIFPSPNASVKTHFSSRTILLAALIFATFVTPSRTLASGMCAGPTLSSLEGQGTCVLGDLTISSFAFTVISGNPVTPSQIGVTPISSGSLGFTFTIPQGSVQDELVINFLAANTNGNSTIEDLSLAISTGFSGSVENVCVGAGNTFIGPNGVASCSNTSNTAVLTAGFGNPLSTSTTFPGVSAVDTSNGFIISPGTSTDTLTEQISQTTVATPEPQTDGLLLLGLMAGLCARVFRRNVYLRKVKV
jgi:hypothetical protein